MVEGPGCMVKGEVMKKKISKQTVINFKGSVVDKVATRTTRTDQPEPKFERLIGAIVANVRTLGKELFIFFTGKELCLRVHFLMNGSVRYGQHSYGPVKIKTDPVLVIEFVSEVMFIFESSVDLRSAAEMVMHCDNLADLDICVANFNFGRANDLVIAQSSELICDVIMDQEVLPGVGNIIKNEALFNSGINPNTIVADLSSPLVACLIRRLREFSAIFYKCRKENKPLQRHLRIYKKQFCPECKNQVTICKPGRLVRLTFFCQHCQTNSARSEKLTAPKRNSLLGYVQYVNRDITNDVADCDSAKTWPCDACTFINKPGALVCDMCLTVRTVVSSRKRYLAEIEASETAVETKRIRRDDEVKDNVSSSRPTIPSNIVKSPLNSQLSPLPKIVKSPSSHGAPLPVCSGHGKMCVKRTVTRSGENKGRIFFTCSFKQDKQCKFFQWADSHHPMCAHGKVSIVHQVLKQNENNGRQFYCCPLQKNEQCNFFQWV